MSLYAVCPHCSEYRTVRADSLPDELIHEPCDGCDESDAKLDWIAAHEDEPYPRRDQ